MSAVVKPMPAGARATRCDVCGWTFGTHAPDCDRDHEHDPTPWCSVCGDGSGICCTNPQADND